MGFSTDVPNDRGPRPGYGGAMPGPLSRAPEPAIPNESPGGDREKQEGAKKPPVGSFVAPPNEHAPAPGYGGKM